jgi:protein subunit release factor B
VEVRRFVALLAEEVMRLATERGLAVGCVSVHGDDGAPRSVEIDVAGEADLVLRDLGGTHALVARSVARGNRSRKRWFAGVSIHPAPTHDGDGARLDDRDLVFSAMRAGGPGGQHVNKTSTAVRILHKPTGITVKVSSERSQYLNRKVARNRIALILERQHQATVAERSQSLRLSHYQFERGSAVCVWRPAATRAGLVCETPTTRRHV